MDFRLVPPGRQRPSVKLLIALGSVLAAAVLRALLDPLLGEGEVLFLTFYPAIVGAALLGGAVPGAIATVLAGAIANYFWMTPRLSFRLATEREYVMLGLFFGGAALIIAVCEARRRAAARERQAMDGLRASEQVAREQVGAMERLHAIGALLVTKNADVQQCLLEIVDTAIILTGADKGNFQVFDDDRQALRIVAHRRFDAPFLSFFATVDASDASACVAAMRSGDRIVVDDVEHSAVFTELSRDALITAGVRAVQSTPLRSSAGTLLGMVSTHFSSRHRPSERQLRWMDLLARQAADFLERKRTDDRLLKLNVELRESDRRKDTFIAMLSHELRNPLSAIGGAASVLNMVGNLNEPSQRARAVIARQVQHLSRLVDDLLDATRITTGKIVLNRQPLDLAEAGRNLISVMRSAGRLDRNSVTTELASVWVDADEARVTQIFTNLIDNALKFTPVGSSINVKVRAEGDEAVLEVSDSGVGIAPELVESVFDLFVQGESTLDRAQGGLGIGLTLVKNLVEMHSGRVCARSDGRGKGASFTIVLPSIAVRDGFRSRESSTPMATRRHRILIVEDNDDAREMLHTVLTMAGHDVHDAVDGASALEALQSLRPDVALIDVGLPALDGYEVVRKARQLVGQSVKLVALTGYGRAEDRARALEAGFDHHLVKPLDPSALAAVFS